MYDGTFAASSVRGKIVIIGAASSILQDQHATATTSSGAQGSGSLMFGAEVQANAAATVLAELPLRDAPGWPAMLAIVVMAAAVPLAGLRGWSLRALPAALLLAAAYAVICQLAFDSGRILAFVDPLATLVISLIGTLAVVYLTEAFERQYARTIFARFVPPGVVDEVLSRTDDDLRLGGVQRVCTVMFSDLRGFTSFAETQPAARVIEVVNHYLNEMTEAILDAGGTLIAYMGDGIMAVFGTPIEQEDHADRALRAAAATCSRYACASSTLARDRADPALRFRMGIGLNSGPVMAGNVGARERVEYTAIGDTTNTAARLEGMTKGRPYMLFSRRTREMLRQRRLPTSSSSASSTSAGAARSCRSIRSRIRQTASPGDPRASDARPRGPPRARRRADGTPAARHRSARGLITRSAWRRAASEVLELPSSSTRVSVSPRLGTRARAARRRHGRTAARRRRPAARARRRSPMLARTSTAIVGPSAIVDIASTGRLSMNEPST